MSKKIECRLPDQLYNDLKAKCHDNKITITNAVISNITDWLYGKKQECHDNIKYPEIRASNKEPICHYKDIDQELVQPGQDSAQSGAVTNGSIPGVIRHVGDIPVIIRRIEPVSHHPACACASCALKIIKSS